MGTRKTDAGGGRRPKLKVHWRTVKLLQEQNEKLIFAMIYRVLPDLRTGSPDFEDAVQIGRVALWKSAMGYDENFGTTFATYACKGLIREFVRLRAVMHCRGFSGITNPVAAGRIEGPRRETLRFEDLEGRAEEEPVEPLPNEVQSALAKLSDRDRTVVDLRYWQGMPYREIAEVLGVTHERVRQIERRVVERLREDLGAIPPKDRSEPFHRPARRCVHCTRGIPNVGMRRYCRPGTGCRKSERDSPAPLVFGSAVKKRSREPGQLAGGPGAP